MTSPEHSVLSDEELERLKIDAYSSQWRLLPLETAKNLLATIDSLRRTVELQGDVVSAARVWKQADDEWGSSRTDVSPLYTLDGLREAVARLDRLAHETIAARRRASACAAHF